MIIIKFFVLCNVFKFCGLFGVKGIMFLINDIFFNVIIKKKKLCSENGYSRCKVIIENFVS